MRSNLSGIQFSVLTVLRLISNSDVRTIDPPICIVFVAEKAFFELFVSFIVVHTGNCLRGMFSGFGEKHCSLHALLDEFILVYSHSSFTGHAKSSVERRYRVYSLHECCRTIHLVTNATNTVLFDEVATISSLLAACIHERNE